MSCLVALSLELSSSAGISVEEYVLKKKFHQNNAGKNIKNTNELTNEFTMNFCFYHLAKLLLVNMKVTSHLDIIL